VSSDLDPQLATINAALLAQIKAAEIKVARDAIDRVVRENHPSAVEIIVDGVPGRPVEEVQPFGVIEAHFGYGTEIVSAALEILRALSPVKTGAYQRSHQIYVDGSMVPDGADIGAANHIVIASTLPYSKKIEHGESKQAPDGVYAHAVDTLRRRFGNSYRIEAGWAGIGGDAVIGGSAGNKSDGRYPALVIDRIAP